MKEVGSLRIWASEGEVKGCECPKQAQPFLLWYETVLAVAAGEIATHTYFTSLVTRPPRSIPGTLAEPSVSFHCFLCAPCVPRVSVPARCSYASASLVSQSA